MARHGCSLRVAASESRTAAGSCSSATGQVDTLILAGINTTSCVLCCGFEATNRDYRVVIAADAVDSMDGEEMHGFALRLMAATVGWVLANNEIIAALGEQCPDDN